MAVLTAEEYKQKGNLHFKEGEYADAIKEYTSAIIKDSQNPVYYTNRALCYLRLKKYEETASDARRALELDPNSFKGHYFLGMALTQMDHLTKAETHLRTAYDIALSSHSPSAVNVSEAILQARKKRWELEERVRLEHEAPLLSEIIEMYDAKLAKKLAALKESGISEEEFNDEKEFYVHEKNQKIQELTTALSRQNSRYTPKETPGYLIDPISFSLFTDPVISKSGQTYERSWILEHLKKSQTDPFSRQHLTPSDLIPNLALKQAAEDFIAKEGSYT